VKQALAAGVLAVVLSIAAGPAFIAFLRSKAFGQHIREEGPAGHQSKQGTPTMGGVVLLASALFAFALFSEFTTPALTVAGVTVACAAIGFIDDYFKLARRRSLGLSGRWKMLLLIAVTAALGYVANREGLSTDVYLPIIDTRLELGPAYYALLFLVVAGGANAVNLTDGLDGLAAGTMAIAMLTYTAMAIVAFLSPFGFTPEGDPTRIDLAIIGAAMVGACVGFLWYNAYPADVFMGDVGALALGAALGTIAVIARQEIVLFIMGGVFVVETLSVIVQVISFKLTGRRVFRMAPLHHHYELKGWKENQVVVRFWIITMMLVLVGLSTLKLR